MPVLSNNGRLISSLPITSTVSGQDELLLQSNGVTKRISYASLSGSILSSNNFSPFNATVNFTSPTNKFTGSFYNENNYSCNFYTVAVRNTLTGNTIIATSGFSGNVTGNITSTGTSTFSSIDVNGGAIDGTSIGNSSESTIKGTRISASIGFRGNITSIGTSTFSNIDVNGGTIDGTSIGNLSESTIKGTRISASIGFRGNITGSIRGDVYSQNGDKVLENGTSANPNGNVPTAFFYGTSSYAIQALTAAYAAAGGSAINGVPIGGNQYQILAKNTNTNYDVGWTNPISRSGSPSQYDMTMWNSAYVIKNAPGFTYSAGSDLYIYNKSINVNNRLTANSITSSFYGGPGGFKKQGTIDVSFWGTGSHAVTASYVSSLVPVVNTSTGTVADFVGGTNEGGVGTYCYAITHGFGASPSSIRATLYCDSSDAGVGYVAGDEVDLNVVESNQLDANIFSTWTNSTYAAVSVAGNTGFPNDLYIPAKTGGTWPAIDKSKWKFKIRVWK
jgi:hypothetical protein